MKILILGGTAFLGPQIVEAARARGHVLTLFNRGKTNPGLFPDIEKLHGDRDGDLKSLEGRTWDAVVDTSGYVPRHRHDVRGASRPERQAVRLHLDDLGLRRRASSPAPPKTGRSRRCPTRRTRRSRSTTARSRRCARRPRRRRCPAASGSSVRTDRRPRRQDRSLHVLARARREGGRGAGPRRRQRPGAVHRRARPRRVDRARRRAQSDRHLQRDRSREEAHDEDDARGVKKGTGGDAKFTWVSADFLEKNEVAPVERPPRVGSGTKRRGGVHADQLRQGDRRRAHLPPGRGDRRKTRSPGTRPSREDRRGKL